MLSPYQEVELHAKIRESNDLAFLMRVVASEQAEYWYDPCGKSGFDFEEHLTNTSILAIRQAQRVLNLA